MNSFRLKNLLSVAACVVALQSFASAGDKTPGDEPTHAGAGGAVVLPLGIVRLNKEFLNAAEAGNIERVKKLLDGGASVDAQNNYGETALMLAAIKKHVAVAILLLDGGADVNTKDSRGNTALTYAAMQGNVELATLLLDRGVDMDIQNKHGRTALMSAAFNGKVELATLLLEHGDDIEAQNKSGKTALDLCRTDEHRAALQAAHDAWLCRGIGLK